MDDKKTELRKQAEGKASHVPEDLEAISPAEMRQTLHELRVHQIELELQKEELLLTQAELETSRARYFDLYELAPVGYVTVSQKGLIPESNLTAATMLGVLRDVPGSAHPIFTKFVHSEDQDIYYRFRKQLLETGKTQACELRMVKKDGQAFWAHLEASIAQAPSTDSFRQCPAQAWQGGEPAIRIVISDISPGENLKEANRLLDFSRYAESVVETVRESLLVLDADLKIISANPSFYRTFQVNPDETMGSFIYDLGNGQWNIPKLRELLETILPQKTTFDDYEVEHDFTTIGKRTMLLNARQIPRGLGKERIILLAIEDITARRDIENGLEKSRKELAVIKIVADEVSEYAESVINTVREPLIALDQDLRVVTVSRSFYEFFKVNPKDTVGQLIYDLGNRQWDIPKLRELLETILPQKTTFDNYEVEHNFATIGRRIMLLNARQIQRVLGKERIILLAIEDITERKAVEEALQKAGSRLSLAARAGGVGIWDYDLPDNHLTWDDQMLHLYGITRDHFGGVFEAWLTGLHPEDMAQGELEIQLALRGEKEFDTEFRVVWPDGTIHSLRALALVQRDAAGQPLRMIGTNWDITPEKQMEEALAAEKQAVDVALEYAESIIGTVRESLIVLDQDLRVITTSLSFYAFFKVTPEDTVGQLIYDLGDNQWDIPKLRELLETILPEKATFDNFEVEHDFTTIGKRTMLLNARQIPRGLGKERIILLAIEDITERKAAEEALREINRQLELTTERANEMAALANQANEAKSQFVANMSHEIRTPMNAILGFAQVLERDPSLTPQQAEYVQTIHRSGGHLLRLINDILDVSKIEAGQSTLNEASFCLHDLLDDLEKMFRSRINAKGLEFTMERDGSLPPYVVADEGKLRQVVVNLIGNAEKFTETGGVAVRVRAEAVEGISGEDKETLRLLVEVEDTGRGIPDKDLVRIFGLFQQAGTGVKAGGTGLGLAISRKLAEMMGGEITVTSEAGKGSCFRFAALLKLSAAVGMREKAVSRRIVGLEPATGPFRILVVDDEPANRALLCTLLRPLAGFEVAEATNGVEALEIFSRWSPQVVLMDMRMPVMDGYEATRRIKATEAGRATKIIAITASAFNNSRQEILAMGVDDYFRKPIQVAELFGALGRHLDLRYVFAEETDNHLGQPARAPMLSAAQVALPQELVQAMRQAVERCDITQLKALIVQVEKFDSNTARRLRALADRYNYAELSQWLEKSVTDND